MKKTLRFLAKTFVFCLCLCIFPVSLVFWLFCFAPAFFISTLICNIIIFAKDGDDALYSGYGAIWWFFWAFVMFNPSKAENYI